MQFGNTFKYLLQIVYPYDSSFKNILLLILITLYCLPLKIKTIPVKVVSNILRKALLLLASKNFCNWVLMKVKGQGLIYGIHIFNKVWSV